MVDYTYFAWDTVGGDGRARLKHVTAGTLQDLTNKYDPIGNVLTITDAKAGGTQVQAFTYDHLHRLSTAQATGGVGGTYGQESYQYNFAGNLTSKAGRTLSYTDTLHVHAVGAATGGDWFKYDLNGNMTQRKVGSDTYDLTYDQENRLVEVKKNSNTVATFTYDGDSRRVKAVFGANTTGYVGAHYERTGSAIKKYYSSGGVRVAMRDSALPNNPYYLLGDHLGSTAITADNNGAKYAELRYKAWGENRHTDGATPTAYRFTGQREDVDIGLYFYNARYYDAYLGRWTQPDSIIPQPGNPQSLNRYTYANNNPVTYIDKDGHIAFIPLLIAGALLVSKVIDYGWTAWDSYQSLRVIKDPKASQAAKTEAKANLALTVATEALEPDDLLPIGLPLDDLARRGFLKLGKQTVEEASQKLGKEAAEQGTQAARKLVDGMRLGTTDALTEAETFLGKGYKEVANGVFQSTDGLRTVRMTPHELESDALHLNFETWRPGRTPGRKELVENIHVYLEDAQ